MDQALPPGMSRETQIRRDAHGRWFDGPDPIAQPRIEAAFDRWLDRADDGRYCLRNTIHWVYVAVEGPPLFVRSVLLDPPTLFFSDGSEAPLDPASLIASEDGALYGRGREGRLLARFDNGALSGLAVALGEDARGIYLELGGARFRWPVVADPLA